jgi:two-component SAPR family response regulator
LLLKAVVVDDEWYSLEEIAELVEKTGFLTVAKKYTNPLLMLDEADAVAPHVAFIDIEMPGINGIALAEQLVQILPSLHVVFITAYSRYAVDAFELNALDYILKPIHEDRFSKMAERLRHSLESDLPQDHRVKINCFGRLEVLLGGLPVKWQRSSAEELFAFLIIHHGHFVHKDMIIENLWPDTTQKKALQLLQTSIYKIRSVFSDLGDQFALEYAGNRYRLYMPGAECDYFAVTATMNDFRKDNPSSFSAVEAATALYKKGLFAEQGYLWSPENDEKLRNRLMWMLSQIADSYQAGGEPSKLIGTLQRLIEFMPYDERLNLLLLKTMEQLGLIFEAETHLVWLRQVLRDQYDMPLPVSLEGYAKH